MSTYELEAHVSVDSGPVRVDVSGELDLTNARQFEVQLDKTVRPKLPLVLDLNGVSFIDSAALHVLFRLARTRGRERFALIVAPSAPTAGTLEIAGLREVATVCASTEELALRQSSL